MEFSDIELICKLCGKAFTWTAGEQQFYHDKGLSRPKKCQACRADFRRKLHRQQEEQQVKAVQHGR